MQVLVVGYGKIGKIKAALWKSFGATVFVHDVDERKLPQITKDGFTPFDSTAHKIRGIADISTPAGHHFTSVAWCISEKSIDPITILVEKPLASSPAEIQRFETLLHQRPELKESIFVNESYYSSTALKTVLEAIQHTKEHIRSIRIDLSKNRLTPPDKDRFFDAELSAIGIEVPHMLAILDTFNTDTTLLANGVSPQLHIDASHTNNQAFILATVTSPHITCVSFLGNFREDSKLTHHDEAVVRTVTAATDSKTYSIEFDPVPDCPRFMSRITVYEDGVVTSQTCQEDNHLKQHLRLFFDNQHTKYRDKIGVENALAFAHLLVRLKDKSKVEYFYPRSVEKQTLDTTIYKESTDGIRI